MSGKARLIWRHNVQPHIDVARAIGVLDIDVEWLNVGLLTIPADKIYGPKGGDRPRGPDEAAGIRTASQLR
ncbi:hypothetical protein [Micromonospora sp. NBC_01796]|uniref:hypothetical protein n=1 Tax=Micromonospora sp. NBC_01796 TaxID=2975987 RepID=UPI002DD8342F|nr:hypothetical protein [Micromonospora sp. NBC_01796]WSA87908.1 hypothetical protein OIE47_10045 [Micromonospora sp. NBC_01796]